MQEPTWPMGEGTSWASMNLTTRVPLIKACSEWHQALRDCEPRVCGADIGAVWPKWLKKEECWRIDLTAGAYVEQAPSVVVLLIYPTGKAKLRFLNPDGSSEGDILCYYPMEKFTNDTKRGMLEAFAVACDKDWIKATCAHLLKVTEK